MDWLSFTMLGIYCILGVAVSLLFGAVVHYGNPDTNEFHQDE